MAPSKKSENRDRKFVHQKGQSKPESTTKRVSFKNQIRSLKRLLAKEDLPEEVRKAKEHHMTELEGRLGRSQRLEKYRLRYKKSASIRFFERRKAERKLTKAKKTLAMLPDSADADTRRQHEQEIEDAQNDVYYVKHFPINKKYISLFVKSEHHDPKAEKKIQRIRQNIMLKLAQKKDAEQQDTPYDSDNEGDHDAHDDFFLQSDSDDDSSQQ